MPRYFLGWCCVFILAMVTGLAASSQDGKHKRESYQIELDAPVVGIHRVNKSLRDLGLALRQNAQRSLADAIEWLISDLALCDSLNEPLKSLETSTARRTAFHQGQHIRAMAWLNAWDSFGRLIMLAKRTPQSEQLRDQLVGLEKHGVLGMLLKIHSQMSKQTPQSGEPLREQLVTPVKLSGAEIRASDYFVIGLAYRTHDNYIPSVSDLIGNYRNGTELNERSLLSLWSLVNLQLDSMRGNGFDLNPLISWTEGLAEKSDQLESFGKSGIALTIRVRKIAKFLKARSQLQNADTLMQTVDLVYLDRIGQQPVKEQANKAEVSRTILTALESAYEPIEGESLPVAGIWLNYLHLISHQGESAWSVKKATLKPVVRVQEYPIGAYLRWNGMPPTDHFDRALHDATNTAYLYLTEEALLPKLEKERWQPDKSSYLKALQQYVNKLQNIDSLHVQAYIPKVTSPQLLADLRTNAITIASNPKLMWNSSATEKECQRIATDIEHLSSQLRSRLDLNKTLYTAYELGDFQQIRGLSTFHGGAEWDPTALPISSYRSYLQEVEEALKELKDERQAFQFQIDLRNRLITSRIETEIASLEWQAAKLGQEIAQRGEELARVYKKIAGLNIEVAKLGKEAEILCEQAKAKDVQASGMRLMLAERARDLAAAEVEALKEAEKKALEMVDSAVRQLNEMKPRLNAIADKIADSKKPSFLSFLRAIVKVIGLVLAPFTGGSSIGVCTAIDQAIGIIEKVQHIDFNDFAGAIKQIGDVAKDVGQLADFTVEKWGSEKLKKGWSDIKSSVTQTANDLKKNIQPISDEANKLINHFKSLPKDQWGPIAAAISQNLPVNFTDGTISIKLEKNGIRFTNPKLKSILESLLKEGGTIGGNFKDRLARVEILNKLNDATWQTELSKAVDELVQVLPPELQIEREKAEKEVKRLKGELITHAATFQGAERRFFNQLLSGGLVLVWDKNKSLVAIERNLMDEVKSFQQRVAEHKSAFYSQTIVALSNKLADKNNKLQAKIEQCQRETDDTKLREIANGEGPESVQATINAIQEQLTELKKALDAAKGKLEDLETNVSIASLQTESAKLLTEAAKQMVKEKTLREEIARLAEYAATLEEEIVLLTRNKAELHQMAAVKRYELSLLHLRNTYADCSRWGVNSETGDASRKSLSITSVMAMSRPSDQARMKLQNRTEDRAYSEEQLRQLNDQASITKASKSLVGMIQWLRIVGKAKKDWQQYINDNGTLDDCYMSIVNSLHGDRDIPAQVSLIKKNKQYLDDWFKGVRLETAYFAQNERHASKLVNWLTETTSESELEFVAPECRAKVIGRIDLLFTHDQSLKLTADDKLGGIRNCPKGKELFVLPKYIRVKCDHKQELGDNRLINLFYLVIPASDAFEANGVELFNPARAVVSKGQPVRHWALADLKDSIMNDIGLHYDINVHSALGKWSIYLFDDSLPEYTKHGDQKARIERAKAWKKAGESFEAVIGYIETPKP